jgi:hypothetical protein
MVMPINFIIAGKSPTSIICIFAPPMKKIFLIITLCICAMAQTVSAQCPANALLSESFFGSTQAPAGWTIFNCDIKGNVATLLGRTDSFRVGMNDLLDTVITKPINCPDSLNFYYKASGASSNWTVMVQYSTDFSNWFNLDSIKTTGSGSPTNYVQKKIKFNSTALAPPFTLYFRWRMTARVSGTFYLDDVCITSGVCHATATQFRFTNSPTNCTGTGLPFSVTVSATDANGFVDTTFNGPVTLALASGAGALSGTLSQNAVAGNATFNNTIFSGVAPLSITASGGGFTTNAPLTTLDVRTTCPNVDTLKVMTYNLLNFPNGGVYALGGACTLQEAGPKRWDTLKFILAEIKPDILIVQELQTQAGADSILLKSFNVNGVTKYARAPYIPNKSTSNINYNNELFYNTDKLVLQKTATLGTSIRDCGHYVLYCKDPMLNIHHDTTFIDMYSIHTKAKGLTAAQATLDSTQRANDCKLVMDSIRYRQSTSRNAIIGGDMNLYTSAEGAFINFTTGQYKFNDPIPANPPTGPNPWESNPVYAPLHTQAARSSSRLSLECGAKGGLDSRLDFLLATDDIMAGTKHITFIPGTYQAYGNSGNLYNRSIDTTTNTSGVPMAVLKKMANMSDHIPVIMKLAVQFPVAMPLAITENLSLMGKMVGNDVQLHCDAQLQTASQKMELLCDGQVIFTQQNPMTQTSFVHKNVKNGIHRYQVRVQNIAGQFVMSNTISLTQFNAFTFSISPNPFDQQLVIHADDTYNQTVNIYITTINGNIVQQINNANFTNGQIIIPTVQYNKGLYFVTISNAVYKKVYKVVKQ